MIKISYFYVLLTGEEEQGVCDGTLLKIAKKLGATSDKLFELGIALGLSIRQVTDCISTNRMDGNVTFQGTLKMLCTWKENTPKRQQFERLKKALSKAELTEIADDVLVDGMNSLIILL